MKSLFTVEKRRTGMEGNMIQFDEEVRKFQKCTEIGELENMIYEQGNTDIADIMLEMFKELKDKKE